jgi:hypothetical protein
MKTSIRNLGIPLWLTGLLLTQLVPTALHAQGGPTLVSSVPANNATGVALDSKIVFTFSKAMQVPTDYSQAIIWGDALSQLDSGNFSYAWSAGNTVLTSTYAGNLPSSDVITWTLNPTEFLDTMGNPLGFNPIPFGAFTTTSGGGGGGTNDCPSNPGNGSFTSYNIFKSAMYVQNDAAAPTPDTSSDPFIFSANVSLATNRTATSVTLTPPGGSPQPMQSFFGSPYIFFDSTNDLSKLDALYPSGNYTFTVSGSPNQTVVASLPVNVIPNTPHASNYSAAQTINAGADFTLNWDPFVGGTTNDFIIVEVKDASAHTVFQITNSFGCLSSLPGTATSVIIPARTLQSNQTYIAQITFEKSVSFDTSSYPGSAVFIAGESTTKITISTGSGSAPPLAPVFTNIISLASAQISFQLQTQAGHAYVIEFNSDLANSNGWTLFLSSNALGSVIQVTDTVSASGGARFYRARAN